MDCAVSRLPPDTHVGNSLVGQDPPITSRAVSEQGRSRLLDLLPRVSYFHHCACCASNQTCRLWLASHLELSLTYATCGRLPLPSSGPHPACGLRRPLMSNVSH